MQAALAFGLWSGVQAQDANSDFSRGALIYGGFTAFSEGVGILGPFSAPGVGLSFTAVRNAFEWSVMDAYASTCCGEAYTVRVGTGFAWNSAADGAGVQLGGGGGVALLSTGRAAPSIHAEIGAGTWASSGLRVKLRYEEVFGAVRHGHLLVLAGIRLHTRN